MKSKFAYALFALLTFATPFAGFAMDISKDAEDYDKYVPFVPIGSTSPGQRSGRSQTAGNFEAGAATDHWDEPGTATLGCIVVHEGVKTIDDLLSSPLKMLVEVEGGPGRFSQERTLIFRWSRQVLFIEGGEDCGGWELEITRDDLYHVWGILEQKGKKEVAYRFVPSGPGRGWFYCDDYLAILRALLDAQVFYLEERDGTVTEEQGGTVTVVVKRPGFWGQLSTVAVYACYENTRVTRGDTREPLLSPLGRPRLDTSGEPLFVILGPLDRLLSAIDGGESKNIYFEFSPIWKVLEKVSPDEELSMFMAGPQMQMKVDLGSCSVSKKSEDLIRELYDRLPAWLGVQGGSGRFTKLILKPKEVKPEEVKANQSKKFV